MSDLLNDFLGDTPEIEGIDFVKLRGWMDGRNIGSGPIGDVEQLPGGTQNIMVRFNRGDDRYVLRRPPLHKRKNSDKTMLREARVLGAIAGSQVPHPTLVAACPDTWVLDAAFYLATWVDGFNPSVIQPDYHVDTEGVPHRMGLSHVEAIAHLGNIDWQKAGLDDFGNPEGWLARQVPRWTSHHTGYLAVDGYTVDDLVGVETIGRWLERHLPEQSAAGIVHGDCHLSNTMFEWETPELAALVDWELATIGDPLLDLGWILATNPTGEDGPLSNTVNPITAGFPSQEEVIAHYGEVSGRSVEAAWWYGVLACWKLAIIIEGTWVRFLQGKATEEVGQALHTTAISLMQRAESFMLRHH